MKVRNESGCLNSLSLGENQVYYGFAADHVDEEQAFEHVLERLVVLLHREIKESEIGDRLHGIEMVQTVEFLQGLKALFLVKDRLFQLAGFVVDVRDLGVAKTDVLVKRAIELMKKMRGGYVLMSTFNKS